MNIIKDKRQWKIQVNLNNEDCPYLFYPANYHGCYLVPEIQHEDDKGMCRLENCPLRIVKKL